MDLTKRGYPRRFTLSYTETVFDKKVIATANSWRVSIRGRPCESFTHI